ncbi:MAG: ATP-grasp domain-containing protein [Ruminococcus sp.]|nr:ATP-grasp domain-containing protein [Ruminococcus sp.]
MKRVIVVAEPMSTAFNFLEDIKQRGFEPVILESYIPDGYARRLMDEERKIKYSRIKYPIKIIKEDKDYNVTLKMIHDLDPVLVLAGSEEGVVIGTRLADDLGLTGNPYSIIANMTQKTSMQDALKKAGLRYIRSEEASSPDDCIKFLEKLGHEDVVLKHVHGVASVGVHLIHGKDELLDAFRQEQSAENMFGESENRLMVQERIFGEEYIVNTISRNGVPALTSVFKYYKKKLPTGFIVYRGQEAITKLGQKERELVEYAFKTVKALGITDGPVHGEYMIDEKGPVLIEANCRVMGGSSPSGFLNKVFGYHETDVVLDCMLDSSYHSAFLKKPYHPIRKGYIKDFYSDKDKSISSSGIIPIILNMSSYYSGWLENAGKTDIIKETTDLETELGCIYLVDDDPEAAKRDFETLMYIEEEFPELMYSDKSLLLPPKDTSQLTPEISAILNTDTETLINDIISFYKNGSKGKPVVPEILIDADPYNRKVLEILKKICY